MGASSRICRLCLLVSVAAASLIFVAATDAAPNGQIAFTVGSGPTSALETINADGRGEATPPNVPSGSSYPAWSPDGSRLAFSSSVSGQLQIFVINADGTAMRQLTHDPGGAIDPSWSPDGRTIAYTSLRNASMNIFAVSVLAQSPPRQLTSGAGVNLQPAWSPDGHLIAFVSTRTGSEQIFTMTPSGGDQQQFVTQLGQNIEPAWSPRGAQLAYANLLGDVSHLYAIDRAGSLPRELALGDGSDASPAWSPDGSQIVFSRDGGVWVSPAFGNPAMLKPRKLALGVQPSWAPQQPIATAVSHGVTATAPGSSAPIPVTNATALPTGTTVDASTGSLTVSFHAQNQPRSSAPAMATVAGTTFTVAQTAPQFVALVLKRVVCTTTNPLADFFRAGRSSMHVVHGHYHFTFRHYIHGSSPGTTYTVLNTCAGIRVTVTEGVVLLTWLRGRHRSFRVRAHHSFFAPAP